MTLVNKDKIQVCICLGSSCFSQGSNESLKALQEYILENDLDSIVEVKGSLCEGNCKEGPNVKINSDRHTGVTAGSLIDLVKFYIDKSRSGTEQS